MSSTDPKVGAALNALQAEVSALGMMVNGLYAIAFQGNLPRFQQLASAMQAATAMGEAGPNGAEAEANRRAIAASLRRRLEDIAERLKAAQ